MPEPPVRRAIALANAASGAGDEDADETIEWCRRLDLELRDPGDDLAAAVRRAADERPPFVAIVGGDGTVRTAAPLLAARDVALLPVPGGTFNHFAKAHGIATLDDAAAAVRADRPRTVPLADVNGEVFLNTCAIGWYPEMVRTRERLRERWPRPVAALAATVRHLPRLRRFRVDVDGRARSAWLLWAGNGEFGMGPTDVAARTGIDGTLDLRLALAESRLPRTRLLADLGRGRLHGSAHLERAVVDAPVTVHVGLYRVRAALDAEVVELTPPLTFTPASRTIRVLTAPGE